MVFLIVSFSEKERIFKVIHVFFNVICLQRIFDIVLDIIGCFSKFS